MNPEDLLSQLRDLDAPAAIGWWPLAPGWWVLIFLLTLALVFGIYRLITSYRAEAPFRAAQIEIAEAEERYLQEQETVQAASKLLQETNAILKRLATSFDPHTEVAGLTGQSWRNYLSDIAGDQCSATELDAFESHLYQAKPRVDLEELMATLASLTEQMRRSRSRSQKMAPSSKQLKHTNQPRQSKKGLGHA